jgi:hypothetical protein
MKDSPTGWLQPMTLFFPVSSRPFGERSSENTKASKETRKLTRVFLHSLTFMSMTLHRYWSFFELNALTSDQETNETISTNETACHFNDVIFIKTYLIGDATVVALNILILLLMIYHSSRGSITDIKARRFVSPLLYFK